MDVPELNISHMLSLGRADPDRDVAGGANDDHRVDPRHPCPISAVSINPFDTLAQFRDLIGPGVAAAYRPE